MYCTQCGTHNDDQAKACANCQATLHPPGLSTPPAPQASTIPNYLVQSILVTICCCLIPGIVAIVYAAQVNGLVLAGEFAAARRSSRLAFIWSWVGFGLGLAGGLLYLFFVLIGALAAE